MSDSVSHFMVGPVGAIVDCSVYDGRAWIAKDGVMVGMADGGLLARMKERSLSIN